MMNIDQQLLEFSTSSCRCNIFNNVSAWIEAPSFYQYKWLGTPTCIWNLAFVWNPAWYL